MKQLSLNIVNKSTTKVVASSSYDYKIELIKNIGLDDIENILKISTDLSEIYGNRLIINKDNILKYFNSETLPFIARYKKERRAAMRQAKLRLSNIKLEEITQIFRGKSKQIKH